MDLAGAGRAAARPSSAATEPACPEPSTIRGSPTESRSMDAKHDAGPLGAGRARGRRHGGRDRRDVAELHTRRRRAAASSRGHDHARVAREVRLGRAARRLGDAPTRRSCSASPRLERRPHGEPRPRAAGRRGGLARREAVVGEQRRRLRAGREALAQALGRPAGGSACRAAVPFSGSSCRGRSAARRCAPTTAASTSHPARASVLRACSSATFGCRSQCRPRQLATAGRSSRRARGLEEAVRAPAAEPAYVGPKTRKARRAGLSSE